MKKRSLMLFTVLFLLIFASYCYADTFYVTTSDDFRTALDSADENGESDTITLEAGTYVASPDAFQYDENDSEEGYGITIIGSGDVILDVGANRGQVLHARFCSATKVKSEFQIAQNSGKGIKLSMRRGYGFVAHLVRRMDQTVYAAPVFFVDSSVSFLCF